MSSCLFIESPKIEVVYVYPLDGAQGFCLNAYEFANSYKANPPGMEHDSVIVCNGAPAAQTSKDLFSPLPNLTFLDRDDSGWDIGAFQFAAQRSTAKLMVFCGGNSYFRKPGWLVRMWETFCEFGDTLYGSTGNQGDPRSNVYPHVRTTGFWCSPKLMNDYPHRVKQGGTGGERYEFEHGKTCFTGWVTGQGLRPWIVGWDCMWPVWQADQMPGGFHNGEQYNILVGDRLTRPPYWPHP